MDPVTTGAIISGVSGLATSMLGGRSQSDANDFNAAVARDAQQFNADQAQINREFNSAQAVIQRGWTSDQTERQMQFQREMSGTSYQRAVADMMAAGLNPMLAYSQGGASTPAGASGSGATASGSSASAVPYFREPELKPALIGTALQAARLYADIERTSAETDEIRARTTTERERPELTRRQAQLTNQQIHESISRMHLTGEQREKVKQEVVNLKEDQGIKAAELFLKRLEMQVKEAKSAADINEAIAEARAWASEYGQEWRPYVRDFGQGGGSAAGILRSIQQMFRRR